MWTVNVPDAGENADHTLKVTVNGGYSRIDYAVVTAIGKKQRRAGSLYSLGNFGGKRNRAASGPGESSGRRKRGNPDLAG